jgi:subtilisin-like proprotein convertase family protein
VLARGGAREDTSSVGAGGGGLDLTSTTSATVGTTTSGGANATAVSTTSEVGPTTGAGGMGGATVASAGGSGGSSSSSSQGGSGGAPGVGGGGGAGSETVKAGPGLALEIVDDGYLGGLTGMACVELSVAGTGMVKSVALEDIGITHTACGHLVIKVVSPGGTVLTVLNRAQKMGGPDDGSTTDEGDKTNLAADFPLHFYDGASDDAETLGSMLKGMTACKDDKKCDFYPNPDGAVGTSFADFKGQQASGIWKICVGDAVQSEKGSVDYVALAVTFEP